MDERDISQLKEYLKATKNLADIALPIIDNNRNDLLWTALETLYDQAQLITDEFCIIGEDKCQTI